MTQTGKRLVASSWSEPLQAKDDIEVLRCRIRARANMPDETLSAHVVLEVRCTSAVRRLTFSLASTLRASTLKMNFPCERWYQRGNRIVIVLACPLESGQRFSLHVEYAGRLRVFLHDQVLCAVTSENALLTELWFPWMNGLKTRFDVALDVPAGQDAIAGAPLVSKRMIGRWTRYKWDSMAPAQNMEIAVGRYVSIASLCDGKAFLWSGYERDASRARNVARVCKRAYRFFSRCFGPLPFDAFHVAEIPEYYGGGRGPAPMIWLCESVFNSELTPRFERFLAHEFSHFWWGNLVHGKGEGWLWLQEGLATYSEWLFVERYHGAREFARLLRRVERYYRAEMRTMNEKTIRQATMNNPAYYCIVYLKGALALHRLREGLGERAFYAGLRQYTQQFQGMGATADDFRRAMESASKADLTVFFEKLLDTTGLPPPSLFRSSVYDK